jgi:putative pyruvate formate lyase activating enzyme
MKLSAAQLRDRAAQARNILRSCVLCGHRCEVDRLAGRSGRCGCGAVAKVASALLHPGEEPALGPNAGAVFFAGCGLECVYCQNWQISQEGRGDERDDDALAEAFLQLQADGADCLDLVSPTVWTPQVLAALAVAADRGLRLPVVWNTGGFETAESLRLLDGVVDIYLPDMRYTWADAAERYSGARNYPDVNRSAVLEMHRQVGDLVFDASGRASRGLLIRLLALPNDLSGVRNNLAWIAGNLSRSTWFSLMAQYAPSHRAAEFPEINRPIKDRQYRSLLDLTEMLGLENFYAQEPGSRNVLRPDFERDRPFEN